jgi:hypothetical protein
VVDDAADANSVVAVGGVDRATGKWFVVTVSVASLEHRAEQVGRHRAEARRYRHRGGSVVCEVDVARNVAALRCHFIRRRRHRERRGCRHVVWLCKFTVMRGAWLPV